MKQIRIGTKVKVKGTSIVGKVTYIRQGGYDNYGTKDPTKYKVAGKYWNKSSIRRVRTKRK